MLAPGLPLLLAYPVIGPLFWPMLPCAYMAALLLGRPAYHALKREQLIALKHYLRAGGLIGMVFSQMVFALVAGVLLWVAFAVAAALILLEALTEPAQPPGWANLLHWLSNTTWRHLGLAAVLFAFYLLLLALLAEEGSWLACGALSLLGTLSTTLSSLIFWLLSVSGTPPQHDGSTS
ncbi:hypothetical protein [Leeia sp.]|uniref:hypothetical protein n=1 Tax=Leeia sp. TaxID=2884678 RepID=UPI0035B0D257